MRPDGHTSKKNERSLDQQQVVQAALELLDEVGLDGLTMRGLAKKLDIKAASIYWHVRNKEDLLGLLADEICGPMQEPDRTLPWRQQLEGLGHEYRRILHTHRDAARVFVDSGSPTGPNRLRLIELLLKTLLDAGFNEKNAAYAGFLLNDYVIMFVLEENQDIPDTADDEIDWSAFLDQYPSVIRLFDFLGSPDMDDRFQFGMDILASGLETLLNRQEE